MIEQSGIEQFLVAHLRNIKPGGELRLKPSVAVKLSQAKTNHVQCHICHTNCAQMVTSQNACTQLIDNKFSQRYLRVKENRGGAGRGGYH